MYLLAYLLTYKAVLCITSTLHHLWWSNDERSLL